VGRRADADRLGRQVAVSAPAAEQEGAGGRTNVGGRALSARAFYDDHGIRSLLLGIASWARPRCPHVEIDGYSSVATTLVLATARTATALLGHRPESVCHLHTPITACIARGASPQDRRVVIIGGGSSGGSGVDGRQGRQGCRRPRGRATLMGALCQSRSRATSTICTPMPVSMCGFRARCRRCGVTPTDSSCAPKTHTHRRRRGRRCRCRAQRRPGGRSGTGDRRRDHRRRVPADHRSAHLGDRRLRTVPHLTAKSVLRLESVQNASDHARHIAAFVSGEQPCPYDVVPCSGRNSTAQAPNGRSDSRLRPHRGRRDRVRQVLRVLLRGHPTSGMRVGNSPKDHLRARKQLARARDDNAQSPPPVTV